MNENEPRLIRRTIIIPEPMLPKVLEQRPECSVGVVPMIAALAVMNA